MMSSVRRDWALLAGLTFCFAFGFAVYSGIFQNFIREVFHADARQLGILESLREVPGLLTAFVAGTLAALAEPRLGSVALAVCGAGIALTGWAGDYWTLVAVNVFWSVGFHLWLSVSPGITLSLAGGQEGGRHLGRMAGISAAAVLTALGFTWLAKRYLSYATLFQLAGIIIFAGALLGGFLSHRASTPSRRRLVFRREYGLYYLLMFLEGCRRQIFATFAAFTLIAVYGASVQTMLTLAFFNAALNMVAGPVIGRSIDRYGERAMLTLYYALLIVVFAGYALAQVVGVLYALYMLDSLLFNFGGVGATCYLNRIVRPGEMTPSLAMGTTMNHIAAVLVPATGGLLWVASGNYRLPFMIGIVIALFSLVATQRLPNHRRAEEPVAASAES